MSWSNYRPGSILEALEKERKRDDAEAKARAERSKRLTLAHRKMKANMAKLPPEIAAQYAQGLAMLGEQIKKAKAAK
jgi:hypothetical protein